MKRNLFLLGLTLVLVGSLSCGQKKEAAPTGVEKFEVTLGSQFMIKELSNPSTGFVWELVDFDKNPCLSLVQSRFIAKEGPMVGSPGEQEFTFLAKEKGSTSLILEYRRPWEKEKEPIERKEWLIEVK